MNVSIYEAQQTPHDINTKKLTLRHIMIKVSRVKNKENFESSERKVTATNMGIPLRQSAGF